MLELILDHLKFFHECVWVSLRDVGLGSRDSGLLARQVETIGATAIAVTEFTLCKALAVKLQALRAATLALIR